MAKKIDKLKEEKETLDSLLNDIGESAGIGDRMDIPADNIQKREYTNFNKLYENSVEEADELMKSILVYYLSEEPTLLDDKYVSEKVKQDKLAIAQILFSIKSQNISIIRLSEQIDMGDFNSNNFRVMSELQRSQMENIKHLVQVQIAIENNYAKLFDEYGNKLLRKLNSIGQITAEEDKQPKLLNGTTFKDMVKSI